MVIYSELDGISCGKIITDSVLLCVRLCGREESSFNLRAECTRESQMKILKL